LRKTARNQNLSPRIKEAEANVSVHSSHHTSPGQDVQAFLYEFLLTGASKIFSSSRSGFKPEWVGAGDGKKHRFYVFLEPD
jgi:hypothetical protein